MERRIIVYAPIGKDARLITQVFARSDVPCFACKSAEDVVDELKQGAGALLLADEALNPTFMKQLLRFLLDQPSWADLPVLVMSQRSVDSVEIRQVIQQLGNVTILERPVHTVTLVSAATSALRARQRQYAMREIDRRKDEFVAMLSHELRNPLAPVSAAAAMLRMPNLNPDKIRHTGDIILRQVKHMTGLIDDLLDMSRISRGQITLTSQVVDAREIVATAIEQVRPLIDGRQHRLLISIAPEIAFIEGDQKRLIQVLSNILNNAAKFTPKGGEIALNMIVTDAEVTYTIRDNGIGIAPEVIDSIFDMFSQAERSDDRSQGGLGIGLALVKTLVQLQGGKVVAQSAGAGKGSRFDITYPRTSHLSEKISAHHAIYPPAASLKVLLVDDNVEAAEMLGAVLQMQGFHVEIVHSAGAALAVAEKSQQLDACLLDIGLPDMNGNDLARKLRQMTATSAAMFIAITGYGQLNDREKTRLAGFNYHHVKPVDMDALLGTLATLR